jgi:hypothetical protein
MAVTSSSGRRQVGPRDHRLAAPAVEQRPEHQWADEVADGEEEQVDADGARGDAVEGRQDQRIGEEHGVVGEGLLDEERQPEHRALRVELEDGRGDRSEPDRPALADLDRAARLVQLLARLLVDPALDLSHDLLGLAVAAVDHQPSRRLRHIAAHQQDRQPEHGAQAEGQPPAEVGGEDAGVEQQQRQRGAGRRAQPVGAVDDKVDRPADARRDQLVDRGV